MKITLFKKDKCLAIAHIACAEEYEAQKAEYPDDEFGDEWFLMFLPDEVFGETFELEAEDSSGCFVIKTGYTVPPYFVEKIIFD